MRRKQRPEDLYINRHYPQYAPLAEVPELEPAHRGVLPYLSLIVLAVLGAWGLAKFESGPSSLAVNASPSVVQTPDSAVAYDLSPDLATLKDHAPGEPLVPSAQEQELSRDLAELDAVMSRTERMAQRVGQLEAFSKLEQKQLSLDEAVAGRAIPWNETDRQRLTRKAKRLRHDLDKFSRELEEVASVQL